MQTESASRVKPFRAANKIISPAQGQIVLKKMVNKLTGNKIQVLKTGRE
jgi:hypothetical protein